MANVTQLTIVLEQEENGRWGLWWGQFLSGGLWWGQFLTLHHPRGWASDSRTCACPLQIDWKL